MEAFLISTLVVLLAEIGDKTQLLALLLAARYRKPLPIIMGIFVATILNHAGAGYVGIWLSSFFEAEAFRIAVGVSFIGMGLWTLVPDKLEDKPESEQHYSRYSAFIATLVSFFLVEMGDKTQIATIALAARFDDLFPVVVGTTLGMMLANVPAVLLGNVAASKLPLHLIRMAAAGLFIVLGILAVIT